MDDARENGRRVKESDEVEDAESEKDREEEGEIADGSEHDAYVRYGTLETVGKGWRSRMRTRTLSRRRTGRRGLGWRTDRSTTNTFVMGHRRQLGQGEGVG